MNDFTQKEFNDLAWCAMRYALGRKTYIVSSVCDILVKHVDKLFKDDRYRIGEEIANAINLGYAGMRMDVKEWEKVLTAINELNGKDYERFQ